MDQSDTFLQTPFAPLGKIYCDYFFYLTVINFILLVYILLSALYIFFFDKNLSNFFHLNLISKLY